MVYVVKDHVCIRIVRRKRDDDDDDFVKCTVKSVIFNYSTNSYAHCTCVRAVTFLF